MPDSPHRVSYRMGFDKENKLAKNEGKKTNHIVTIINF